MTSAASTTDAGLITTLEAQVLQLADHEAWLDAQIRELELILDNGKSATWAKSQTNNLHEFVDCYIVAFFWPTIKELDADVNDMR